MLIFRGDDHHVRQISPPTPEFDEVRENGEGTTVLSSVFRAIALAVSWHRVFSKYMSILLSIKRQTGLQHDGFEAVRRITLNQTTQATGTAPGRYFVDGLRLPWDVRDTTSPFMVRLSALRRG